VHQKSCFIGTANVNRIFFPPTEEPGNSENDDWEEVEAGGSAENGPVATKKNVLTSEELEAALPDVPTVEPTNEGPATKEQKLNDEEKL
jgi:hypothetical protein